MSLISSLLQQQVLPYLTAMLLSKCLGLKDSSLKASVSLAQISAGLGENEMLVKEANMGIE